MIRLALVGKDISHSKSPAVYHQLLAGDVDYDLLDYENPSSIPPCQELLSKYRGISITAPYKEHFLAQAIISEDIKPLNAINCLYIGEGNTIHGENTDFLALQEIMRRDIFSKDDRQVVILGSGAMARVCIKVLELNGRAYDQVSRRNDGEIEQYDLRTICAGPLYIINCCTRDFRFRGLAGKGSHFWDLNYARLSEKVEIEKLGYSYHDGEELLLLQAKYALKLWGLTPT